MHLTKTLFVTACLLIAAAHHNLFAQSTAAPVGYLRFWDMLPPENGAFELRKMGGTESEGALFSGTAYRYINYIAFPAGRYNLGVFKKGFPATPVKVVSVDLRPNTFFTVLVAPGTGVINVEVIQDTNDPKINTGSIFVRNYFPGLTVSLLSGTQTLVENMPYGQTSVINDQPLKRIQLTLKTKLPNGSPAESAVEVDLLAAKRATILIIPDSYGRFRPRATIDGKNL